MRNSLMAALAAALIPLSASAQITGTFVAAQDGVNTFQSVDGTSLISSTTATTGLWHDRSTGVFEILGITPSGGYQGQDKAGQTPARPTANEAVTTLTGLTPGTSYDVSMIFGCESIDPSGVQNIDAGFVSGSLTTLTESGATNTSERLVAGTGNWYVAERLIGSTTADNNGEVKVYVNATPNAERSIYNGLSYVVSPPPVDFVTVSTLASPDGAQVFTLEREPGSGALAWSVTFNGRAVVTRGALGVGVSGIGTVADEGTLSEVASREVDTNWTPPYGEQASIPDHFREQTLTLDHAGNGALTVRLQVRAYDEGIALRYLVDGVGALTVYSEMTSFPLPASSQVWVSSSAQGVISKMAIGSIGGAVERPLTAELASDLFVALGEAGLVDHARMKFARSGTSTLVPSLSGNSSYNDAFVTPWRYVRAASSAAGLLQGNHFMLNLNEPSTIGDTSWIRPGKVLREITLTTQGGMACVDFAAAHNLQFVHFDAGWYGPEGSASSDATTVTVDPARSPGPLDLPAVMAHAAASNVGVILYVNHLALEAQLDDLLPLYQSWGVAGIKFGFVNVGAQNWTSWLHDAISKCADYQMMVDVHDEYRMTGVSRTLPNFMTAEGVRGDEASPRNDDVLKTIFTRSLAGAADQTNVYFDSRVATIGSHASQLAKTICVYSPWQYVFWYDRPADSPAPVGTGTAKTVIQEVPETSFLERVPTTWDETRVLDGYPGTHATIARRKGTTWYLAGLNGTVARNFQVALDFLAPGKGYAAEIFVDDPDVATVTQVRIDHRYVSSATVLNRSVAASNGFAVILTEAGPFVAPLPITFEAPGYAADVDFGPLNGSTSNAPFLGVNEWSDSTSDGQGRVVAVGASGEYPGGQALTGSDIPNRTFIGALQDQIHYTGTNSIHFDAQYGEKFGVGFMKDHDADGRYDQGSGGTGGDSGMSFGVGGASLKFEYRNPDFGTDFLSPVGGIPGHWYHIGILIGGIVSETREIVMQVRDLSTGEDLDFDAATPGVQPWSFSVPATQFGVAPEEADGIFVRVTTSGSNGAKLDNLRFTAVEPSPGFLYSAWMSGFTGLTGLDRDQDADPDFDGMNNWLEFLLDGNPTVSDPSILPSGHCSGDDWVVTFTRRDDAEAVSTQVVEYGADLGQPGLWNQVVIGPVSGFSGGATYTVTENGSDPDLITVFIPSGGKSALFSRLGVSSTL